MEPDYLFIFSGNRFKKLIVSTLLYLKAGPSHTLVVTTEGSFLTAIHLDQIEKQLPPGQYCRVHAAYLVAVNKIISFDRKTIQLPGTHIPLDKKYSVRLKERVKIISTQTDIFEPSSLVINSQGCLSRVPRM